MKKLKSAASASSLTCLVTSVLLSLNTLSAAAAERVALLIGVNDYPEPGLFSDLKTPINDVKLIAKSLREAGFEVILVENPTSSEMKTKFAAFNEKITPGGTALFYFAGHAVQFDAENYLMGSSARLLKKSEFGEEAINSKLILDAISTKNPKSSFIFLDCCRSHPSNSWLEKASHRLRPLGLAAMDSPHDMIISYSAAPGEPVVEGEGDHSPYAESLAKQLVSGLEVAQLLRNVGRDVYVSTKKVQRPWTNGNFLHDFYFSEKKAKTEQAYAPVLPMVLPPSGYFNNSQAFVNSAYKDYSEYAKRRILKKVQGSLDHSAPPDGMMGKSTQRAIIAYQTENSLPVTGQLDQTTLTQMELIGLRDETPPRRSSRSSSRIRPIKSIKNAPNSLKNIIRRMR